MTKNCKANKAANRDGEKGAAMVMVLMVFLLLLVACFGVLLEASMNTKKVADYDSEQQAYYAAENGIQTALNVMRGNTIPGTLIDASKPVDHKSNKISFAKAVDLQDSNDPADTASVPRLSRWIDYTYTSPGATSPDRVPIDPTFYSPDEDSAFSIEVFDPDNPNQIISLEVTADIGGSGSSKKFGFLFNTATIKYNSATQAGVGVSTREIGVNLGNFTVSTTGSGQTIPDTRFDLKVKMTAPLKATVVLRGTIKGGKIEAGSMGDVKIEFDSGLSSLLGSMLRIPTVLPLNPPNINGGKTDLNVSLTISEPNRLIIRSTGYGPRGSKKVIEAMIMKDGFNGLIPATLMMVGKNVGSLLQTGSLNTLTFSGSDPSTGQIIPPIGSSSAGGLTGILGSLTCLISCPGGGGVLNIIGNPSNVSEEMPEWLSSPENLKKTVENLKARAISEGRYYTGGAVPPNFGNNADGVGITFIDGDGTFTGSGGGILVTTGKLFLKDDYNYNGIILVTGEGGVVRQGSGTGVVNGNLVVSPLDLGDVAAGFKSPKFDATGIGSSELIFNADLSLADTSSTGVIVVGVVEK